MSYATQLRLANPGDANTVWFNSTLSNMLMRGANSIIEGPTSSTDQCIPRWNGTLSKVQNSGVSIDNSNNVGGVVGLTMTGTLSLNTLPITYTSGAPYQLEAYKPAGGSLMRIGGATHSTVISHVGDTTHNGTNCSHDYIIANVMPTTATYTGNNNVLIGENCGTTTITSGEYNVSIGSDSMAPITTGNFHTSIGAFALGQQTSGQNCVGVGYSAGWCSETDDDVTAVGAWALSSTCGPRNTAVGSHALYGVFNEIGPDNTGVGYECGSRVNALTTTQSSFFGSGAGFYYSDAVRCTSVGFQTGPAGPGVVVGTERLELGWKALSADYCAQLGQSATSPGVNATAKFRTQKFLDEAWIGSGLKLAYNDNSGNMAKSTVTIDSSGNISTINSIAMSIAGATINALSIDGTLSANSDSIVSTQRAVKTYVDSLNFSSVTNEPTGFPSTTRTNSSLAIDYVTVPNDPVFSITYTGTQYVYVHGVKFTKTGTETITLPACAEGGHYIYYDTAGTLQTVASTTMTTFQNAFVAEFYWDDTNNIPLFIADERHEFMPWETHYNLHIAEGTRYQTGLSLANLVVDSVLIGNDSVCTLTVTAGSILDEDISSSITARGTGAYPNTAVFDVFYGTASGWRKYSAQGAPIKKGTNRLYYNSAGTSLVEVGSNNQFVLAHIVATNAYPNSATGQQVIAIMGQAVYGNITAARNGAQNEINTLILAGLPMLEFIFIGSIIYETSTAYSNTWNARVRSAPSGATYVNWLQRTLNPTSTPASHHNLTDLNTTWGVDDTTNDDHYQLYMRNPRLAVTDNHVARWDGASGRYIQDSGVVVDDSNNVSGVVDLTMTGTLSLNTLPIIYTSGTNQLQAYKSAGGAFMNIGGATNSIVLSNLGNSTHNASNCDRDVIIADVLPVTATYSGSVNTFVGYGCGTTNITTANSTCGFGYQALNALTTGNSNSAFGVQTLSAVTTQNNNSAFGYGSGALLTSANNSSFGNNSLGNQCGNFNSAFGAGSLATLNGAGSTYNVGVGNDSGNILGTNATFNTLVGGLAGIRYNGASANNTSIGYNSGSGVAGVGTERLELGYTAVASADYCAQLCQSATSPSVNATAKFRTQKFMDETWIGTGSKLAYIDNSGNIAKDSTATLDGSGNIGAVGNLGMTGTFTLNTLPVSYNSVANQLQAYKSAGGSYLNIGGAVNSVLITNFGDSTHNGSTCSNDVFIGAGLPVNATYSGSANTIVGAGGSGSGITSGASNSVFGYNALHDTTTGSNNSAFGNGALHTVVSGAGNSAFGYFSSNVLTSNGNSSFGYGSLQGACGDYNCAFGLSALNVLGASSTLNVAVGYQAGVSLGTNASYNSLLGASAGNAYTNSSVRNTSIGYNTGPGVLTTCTERLELGYQATASADYCAQLCQSATSPSTNATAKFRTQKFLDEAWIGTGLKLIYNDNSGNMAKSTVTIDSSGNLSTVNSASLTAVGANPGGTNTIWNFTGDNLYFGANPVVIETNGSQTVTLSGIWAVDRSITVKWRKNNNVVSCQFPGSHTTANASTFITSTAGTALPAGVRPSTLQSVPIYVINGATSTVTWGSMSIRTDGRVEIYYSGSGLFTSGNDAGIYANSTVTWTLD